MNDPTLISVFVGVAVIVLMGGAGLVLSKSLGSVAEQRLDGLSGKVKAKADAAAGILMRPQAIDMGQASFWSRFVPNVENLNKLFEAADVNFSFQRFMW